VKQDGTTMEGSRRELDWLGRVAYSYDVLGKVAVYGEMLPGYSSITGAGPKATGFVLAGGIGAAIDLPGRLFANLGVGYQEGQQKSDGVYDFWTRFLRIALGVGMKP
jgi:hypothetical protein